MTKFLDNSICTFKTLLSWRFPQKQRFRTIFLSALKPPPPSQSENFIFVVVSPSLMNACSAHAVIILLRAASAVCKLELST